jgi:membrane protease YdiL (CAAX protease family)
MVMMHLSYVILQIRALTRHASSPFEVGPYLIMATGFVVAYHLSGRNLAMTITLHMINNFISFIAIIMSIIWG